MSGIHEDWDFGRGGDPDMPRRRGCPLFATLPVGLLLAALIGARRAVRSQRRRTA